MGDASIGRLYARLNGMPQALTIPASRGERRGVLAEMGVRIARVGRPGVSADTSAAPVNHAQYMVAKIIYVL